MAAGERKRATVPAVWIGPEQSRLLAQAVERAGGRVVPDVADAKAVVWLHGPPERAAGLLHERVEWVQLDSTGVDAWVAAGALDTARTWTSVRDVYAPDVAEHALAFVLGAARRLARTARASRWSDVAGTRLAGSTVGLVGAGAIGRETIARLRPFGVRILALTRSGRAVDGADESLPAARLHELLARSDYVLLAMPLTPETRGLIGAEELARLGPRGWLVNVGRGGLVDTDALVRALEAGTIAGACLDVTDPEPLPDDHPLWRFDDVLVTPHVANPPGTWEEPLARLVEENVRRFAEGRGLLGVVDLERGY